jgi:hypothetical protein
MPRSNPSVGSVFRVPLSDGGFAIGQVIAYEPQMLNSISCVLTSQRDWTQGSNIPESAIIASLFTTYDLLTKGRWEILGEAGIPISNRDFPFEHLRSEGWVGAKLIGSRNVEEFLHAWFGLTPWDDWADPNYLDKLLFRGVTRPASVTYKNREAEQVMDVNRS